MIFSAFPSTPAFLASGTMAVAYIQYHWKFAFGAAFFPAIDKGELAAVYCFLFVYLAGREAERSRGRGRLG